MAVEQSKEADVEEQMWKRVLKWKSEAMIGLEWIWEGRDVRDDVGRRMLLLIRERVAAGNRGAENDDERGLQTGRESSIGSLLSMVKRVQGETAVVPTTSVLLSRSTGGSP